VPIIEKLNRFARKPSSDQWAAIRATLRIGKHHEIIRDVKKLFGIDSYLTNEARSVLEKIICPYFLSRDDCENVVFVGCDWYTAGYNKWFEERKNYWTIESDPSLQRYGARQHIKDTLQNLGNYFIYDTLDLILCNGVFGWGLDDKLHVEQALQACYGCLRRGGVLVIGWNDINERRPFYLEECQNLHQFEPFLFPPLATDKYVTDTPNRHTYNFYIKS
jgi:SAM-dependent methyltransferase